MKKQRTEAREGLQSQFCIVHGRRRRRHFCMMILIAESTLASNSVTVGGVDHRSFSLCVQQFCSSLRSVRVKNSPRWRKGGSPAERSIALPHASSSCCRNAHHSIDREMPFARRLLRPVACECAGCERNERSRRSHS